MTVAELIAELRKFHPELDVMDEDGLAPYLTVREENLKGKTTAPYVLIQFIDWDMNVLRISRNGSKKGRSKIHE